MKQWIEIENGFLTNKPRYGPMPKGRSWTYYLWAAKCKSIRLCGRNYVDRRKYLHVLHGRTKRNVDSQLRQLMKRSDVKLIRRRAKGDGR